MPFGHDDDFTRLERLIDGSRDDSGADHAGEEPWVRARATELIKSADRIHCSGGEMRSADTAPTQGSPVLAKS